MKDDITIHLLGDICFALDEENAGEITIGERLHEELVLGDYSLAGFESAYAGEDCIPIKKDGPNLNCGEEMFTFLKQMNISAVILANNHVGDYGEQGVCNTLKKIEQEGLQMVGAGKNEEKAYQPLRVTIANKTISFLAWNENEFGVAEKKKSGVAGFEEKKAYEVLRKAKESSDYVIVSFHGGCEHAPIPSPKQVSRYRMFAEWGADAVVGSHTHCMQGYEKYKGVPIVYSMGNFCFPNKAQIDVSGGWYYGYVSKLTFAEKGIDVCPLPICFDPVQRRVDFVSEHDEIMEYLQKLSLIIGQEDKVKQYYDGWTVYSGRSRVKTLIRLQDENIGMHAVYCKNLFSCEAHKELIQNYFDILFEGRESVCSVYEQKVKDLQVIPTEKWNQSILSLGEKDEIQLDRIADASQVIVWGAYFYGGQVSYRIRHIKQFEVIVFCDADIGKQGTVFCGKPVLVPEEAVLNYPQACFVISVPVKYQEEVVFFLKSRGIEEGNIICLSGE